MSGAFGTFIVGIIYLAVLFVLVRPGSQGPTLVTNVADGLSNLVNAGTGGGGWSAKLALQDVKVSRMVCGEIPQRVPIDLLKQRFKRLSLTRVASRMVCGESP
jgi:hypothetical protein